MIFIGVNIPSDPLAWAQAETPIRALRSLEEHQERSHRRYRELNDDSPRKTGVACPKCGGELFVHNPNVVNASSPPSQWATCEKCGHRAVLTC